MKPLPGSGGPGFKSAGAAATAYAPPAAAAPAATTYAPPAAAAPAPVANAAASGSTWDSLAASKPMKPLPGSGGPGFKASSGFPAAAVAAAPVAAAPAPTQEVFAFSEAAPTSGSVWETLKQSKRMKPLPGSTGAGFKASSAANTYSPPAAAAAPVAAAPVAAAPVVSSLSGEGSSVAAGSVWAGLASSKPMKPLPGSTGPGFKTSAGFQATAPPAAAAPVAAAAPTASSLSSEGSSVSSGSVWAALASSKPMKPLPGSAGPGFKTSAGFQTTAPPAAAAAPVAAAAPAAGSSGFAIGSSPVASGNVWDVLRDSKQMKPLKPAGASGNPYFAALGGSSDVSVVEKQALVNDAFAGMMKDIKSLQSDMQIQVSAIDELRDGITALEVLVNDLQGTLEAVLDERDDLRRQLAAAKSELERLYSKV